MTGWANDPVTRRGFLERAASAAALAGVAVSGIPARNPWTTLRDAGVTALPPERGFNLLVIGDSIMWGQGLREEHKFTTLVRQWLAAQLPGVPVQVYRYAHSGAVIRADEDGDAGAPTAGEVPNGYPSITAQMTAAVADLGALPGRENVHLVLTDGGINDLKITTILTTDPTVTDKRAWIRRLTDERCAGRMRQLVPRLLSNFPNAKVVATSYFPIVSDRSDLPSVTRLLHLHQLIPDVTDMITPLLRSTLGAQCRAFHETYVAGVRRAVLDAQPLQVAASASGTPAKPGARAVAGTAVAVRRADPVTRRTAFAEVPFQPENCYGGPQSWLWRVAEEDEVYVSRRRECDDLGLSPAARLKCHGAAMGHPNVSGARAYAGAIIRELGAFLPEWRQQFGVKASLPGSAAPRLP